MYVDPNLPRHLFGWQSPRLGLEMPIATYGERGHPLLVFPRGAGDFLEAERGWLIKAIEPHIAAGRCRVFSIESISRHAWLNPEVTPAEAARRQALYAAYVEEEVVPYIRSVTRRPDARIAVAGAEFGAFQAANQLFRRPDLFDTLVAMSGFYDLEPEHARGHWDDNLYFNNPVSYLAHMHDPRTLDLLRNHTQIHLLCGRGCGETPERSEQLARRLAEKDIPCTLDVGGEDVDAGWTWWGRMLSYTIGERLGWPATEAPSRPAPPAPPPPPPSAPSISPSGRREPPGARPR